MVGVFFCRLRACLALALIAALLVFNLTSQSRAGDAATLNILGFSSDGSVFAFEEYGVQDGSGFPYANRFYIDTETDTFMTSGVRMLPPAPRSSDCSRLTHARK